MRRACVGLLADHHCAASAKGQASADCGACQHYSRNGEGARKRHGQGHQPYGIPLVYPLDVDLRPIQDLGDDIGVNAKYLVSMRNHGKMMEYERCVRKKLRGRFEYMDHDGDGMVTPDCISSGLINLTPVGADAGLCEF